MEGAESVISGASRVEEDEYPTFARYKENEKSRGKLVTERKLWTLLR